MSDPLTQAGHWLAAQWAVVVASPQLMLAYAAAALGFALVLASALARTMMPLRWLALGSNLGLLAYGLLAPSATTAIAAALLLPVNLYRAVEVTRLTRRVHRAATDAEHVGLWLRPHMRPRKLKAGEVLCSKGDRAEHLYLLVQGELALAEAGTRLTPGRIFGEIALFSPSRQRTQTLRCVTACTVLEIHESTVMQLYYQHPSFGFHLIGLLAARLSSDVARAEARLAAPG